MRDAILVALIVMVATLWSFVFTDNEPSWCSDYQLIGRTYDKCITDKRPFRE